MFPRVTTNKVPLCVTTYVKTQSFVQNGSQRKCLDKPLLVCHNMYAPSVWHIDSKPLSQKGLTSNWLRVNLDIFCISPTSAKGMPEDLSFPHRSSLYLLVFHCTYWSLARLASLDMLINASYAYKKKNMYVNYLSIPQSLIVLLANCQNCLFIVDSVDLISWPKSVIINLILYQVKFLL